MNEWAPGGPTAGCDVTRPKDWSEAREIKFLVMALKLGPETCQRVSSFGIQHLNMRHFSPCRHNPSLDPSTRTSALVLVEIKAIVLLNLGFSSSIDAINPSFIPENYRIFFFFILLERAGFNNDKRKGLRVKRPVSFVIMNGGADPHCHFLLEVSSSKIHP